MQQCVKERIKRLVSNLISWQQVTECQVNTRCMSLGILGLTWLVVNTGFYMPPHAMPKAYIMYDRARILSHVSLCWHNIHKESPLPMEHCWCRKRKHLNATWAHMTECFIHPITWKTSKTRSRLWTGGDCSYLCAAREDAAKQEKHPDVWKRNWIVNRD